MGGIGKPRLALLGLSAGVALAMAALGLIALVRGPTEPLLVLALFAALVVLSLRPVRMLSGTDLSPSDAAIIVGALFLPPLAIAPIALLARAANEMLARQRPLDVLRNASAVAVSAGSASIAYIWAGSVWMPSGPAAMVPAAVIAGLALVAVDLAQTIAYVRTLTGFPRARRAWAWIGGQLRAQLLWTLSAVLMIEVVRIEPLFLLPGAPLFALGYYDVRRRLLAERRARVLATLIEVGHAVGASLDPVEVFRAVYHQVSRTLEADAFFVAIAEEKGTIAYRFLVDEGRELEPTVQPQEGTLAGWCIANGRAILVRDERDRARLGFERRQWGTVEEHSLLVAPMRIRGAIIGAISAQSVRPQAYDEGDLELIVAIANEAALAIDRAQLYDRTARLSRGLMDLHRIGAEIAAERDLHALVGRLTKSVVQAVGAAGATIYLDTGGETLQFAAAATVPHVREQSIPKASPLIATVLESGKPLEVSDSATLEPEVRGALEAYGRRALYAYPLRVADTSVGILFVAWNEPHVLSGEERELVGVLAGIGATAIRGLRLYSELDEAYLATVQTLMTTILARDGYREDHQRRVAASAVALGARMSLDEEKLRELRYASLFHSIGKIGVPQSILAKSGPLTPDETRIVHDHPTLGATILGSIRFLRRVVPIVRHANERWDGSGYPDGLAFEAIPYEARVLQIALVYEAMLTDRPYRPALRSEAARAELRQLAGTRFDPGLVSEFLLMVEARGTVSAAEQEVEVGTRELAILAEVTPEFASLLDLQQLLDRVLTILARGFPGSRVGILLREEQTGDLVTRAVAGDTDIALARTRLQPGHGLSHRVLERREPVLIDDVRNEPLWLGEAQARSVLMVPLINEGRAIGVLSVVNGRVGVFAHRDLTLLQAVGGQIGAAIEVAGLHAQLKRAANTDALTGLHNYRYFYDRLQEEVARAERRGTPLAVAYFDIDGLKRVNDRHGHLAGDQVLRLLGETIGEHVRAEDVPARYGGDEFAIVMPHTPRDEAEKVVQRLMDLIDATKTELADGTIVAMPARSWGVAAYPDDGSSPKALVENADTRAYASKRAKA